VSWASFIVRENISTTVYGGTQSLLIDFHPSKRYSNSPPLQALALAKGRLEKMTVWLPSLPSVPSWQNLYTQPQFLWNVYSQKRYADEQNNT
jgi:hypothetical protein